MARIKDSEYKFLREQEQIRKERSTSFHNLISTHAFPNNSSSELSEALKAVEIVKSIRDKNFDIFDVAVYATGLLIKNENDTHSKNRRWEQFFTGCPSNGKSAPDALWSEIKLIQIVSDHTLEQVMTIGTISKINENKKREVEENFEDSSIYRKLKQCFITTYFQEGKQKGHKISESFVFQVEDSKWFERIKEDWEHYRDEYRDCYSKEKYGLIKRRASGIMKSDTHGKRCPNSTLGIRSDSIIFTPCFFKEVSEHYAK